MSTHYRKLEFKCSCNPYEKDHQAAFIIREHHTVNVTSIFFEHNGNTDHLISLDDSSFETLINALKGNGCEDLTLAEIKMIEELAT